MGILQRLLYEEVGYGTGFCCLNEYDLVSASHEILVTRLFLELTSFIMFQKGKTKSAQRVTAVFHCINGFQLRVSSEKVTFQTQTSF